MYNGDTKKAPMGANTPSWATRWLRADAVRGVQFTVRLQQRVVLELHEHDELDDKRRRHDQRAPAPGYGNDPAGGVVHVCNGRVVLDIVAPLKAQEVPSIGCARAAHCVTHESW